MKRVLFLFGMIFVGACSSRHDGEADAVGWAEGSADGGVTGPWADGGPSHDAATGDPTWADASVDPRADAGVYPDDAAADGSHCHPPPPPPPPCHDAGAPAPAPDAAAPDPDPDAA